MPTTRLSPRSARRSPLAAGLGVVALTLSACATGPRPTLLEQVAPADASVQPVLDRLGRAEGTTFTATYTITPPQVGATPVQATVVQDGLRRRTTIGTVAFIVDGTAARTCVEGVECEQGTNDARVSDIGITSDFWNTSLATKLRIDAARSVAPATGSTEAIVNWPSVCVVVAVPAVQGTGSIEYCALDIGVLGRYVGPNVTIELTSFGNDADPAALG